MKAAITTRYGPPEVVKLMDVPDPVPGPGEVLVRIRATTVSSGDARVRGFNMPGVFWIPGRLALGIVRPRRKVLGTEFAGVIEGAGEGVTWFRPGDRVFGMSSFSSPFGTHAELITIKADGLVKPMPEGLSFEDAGCLCFGLLTARHFLQKAAGLRAGERVLVIGAAGAVGCATVQLAKQVGAHVTAVCSTRSLDLVRSLGADEVIDYTAESYCETDEIHDRYDVIIDTIGASSPFACRRVLAQNGRFVAVVMNAKVIVQTLLSKLSRSKRVIVGVASETPEDLAYFSEMIESGNYRSVIDRVFTLDEIIEAHRSVDTWRKQGNIVITIPD